MTPAGIEPPTFRFVAQNVNHCCNRGPQVKSYNYEILYCITFFVLWIIVSCADPVGNVSWILFQEGRSTQLRLRLGVGQAAHTLSIIPKISVLEFYCA